MKISVPVISNRGGRQVFSARVTAEARGPRFPAELWFAIHSKEPVFVAGLADAFLIGLIAVAMKLGENIHVEGRVSSRLAYGLGAFQTTLNTWWPESFRLVELSYEQLDDRCSEDRPKGVACSFSGGLDSFHTLIDLLPSRLSNKAFNITHAMMINGFDQVVDLEHRGLAKRMFDTYQPVLADAGVELLMTETNLKTFRRIVLSRKEVINSYACSLAASAHSLGGLIGRFAIAGQGSVAWNELDPIGSHPALDHHLGSDQLQIIHSGIGRNRAEKLEILVDEPMVRKSLRVCFLEPQFDPATGRVINCGRCEKCVRTLVGLMILGKEGRFPTFSRRYPTAQYQRPDILAQVQDKYLKGLSELAGRHQQKDWLGALEKARELRRGGN